MILRSVGRAAMLAGGLSAVVALAGPAWAVPVITHRPGQQDSADRLVPFLGRFRDL
jgi:hypothetical protein